MDLSIIVALLDLFNQVGSAFDWSNLGKVGIAQVATWIALAAVGVVFHYYADIRKGIIEKGLIRYLFVDYLSATLQTIGAIIAAGAAWFALNPIPAPWGTLIPAALVFGYTFDSLLNKGKKSGV